MLPPKFFLHVQLPASATVPNTNFLHYLPATVQYNINSISSILTDASYVYSWPRPSPLEFMPSFSIQHNQQDFSLSGATQKCSGYFRHVIIVIIFNNFLWLLKNILVTKTSPQKCCPKQFAKILVYKNLTRKQNQNIARNS